MATKDTTEGLDDHYRVPRTYMSSCRLTAQHYPMVRKNGYLLHPIVKRHLAALTEKEICDMATGNGIFALDLHDEYPGTKITGLDMSDKQWPPSKIWPKNLEFGLYNLLTPLPDHLVARFDAVHIRLLGAGVDLHELPTALQHIYEMLKPGGMIQWMETIYPIFPLLDENQNPRSDDIPDYMKMLDEAMGGFVSGLKKHLDEDLFRDAGFRVLTRHFPTNMTHWWDIETDLSMWSLEEVIEYARSKAKDERSRSLLNEASKAATDFIETGGQIPFNYSIFVAQKPMGR